MRVPAFALLVLVGGLGTGDALAQGAGPQPIDGTIAVIEDRLVLDADVSDLVVQKLEEKLQDGLPHTVRIRVTLLALLPEAKEPMPAPLSLTLRTCRLVFDLWGERYAVRVREGERRIERWSDTALGAAQICARLTDVTLAPLGELDLRRNFQVSLRVDIDPRNGPRGEIDRPYFGDPLASGSAARPGGTFFGAMARAFYREEAEVEAAGTLFESPVFGETLIRAALGNGGDEEKPSPPPPKEGEEE